MKDAFEEYKQIIEVTLINLPFLYSGDIIEQDIELVYEEVNQDKSVSPDFINNVLTEIYKESIRKFFKKDIQTIPIHISNPNQFPISIFDIISKSTINPRFILGSILAFKKSDSYIYQDSSRRTLPSYFYPISSYVFNSNKTSLFLTPTSGYYNVPPELDVSNNFYITDKPIQSLIYILQNMDYKITEDSDGWKHTMKYPIYDCQYDIINVQIKDVQKFRDSVLGGLLSS